MKTNPNATAQLDGLSRLPAAPGSATGTLWTLIARCQVCGKELNRATHVPECERSRVVIAAPLMALCDVRSHNTLSDCNIGVNLEWVSESPNAPDQRPGVQNPKLL
jgi:hypothetical protein